MAVCTAYAAVKKKEIEWLWYPYIPYGKLTILQGDPGEGKSTLALQIAAMLTNGSTFAGCDSPREKQTVIYQCAEDDQEDTILSRLQKANADLSKIYFINEDDGYVTFGDSRIEEAVKTTGAKLLIVDPLQAFIPADGDMLSASYMRGLMRKLAQLAQKYRCAVLLIGHMNKSGGKSLYRGLGSIDIAAIARSVLMITRSEKASGIRYMCQVKSNLAPEGDAVAFYLDDDSGFHWIGKCRIDLDNAGTMLTGRKSKQELAEDFLKIMLSVGSLRTTEVLEKLKEMDISEKTARNAGKDLNVKSFKKGHKWYWQLNDEADEIDLKQ